MGSSETFLDTVYLASTPEVRQEVFLDTAFRNPRGPQKAFHSSTLNEADLLEVAFTPIPAELVYSDREAIGPF